jgi:hypothetical protein
MEVRLTHIRLALNGKRRSQEKITKGYKCNEDYEFDIWSLWDIMGLFF